MMIIRRGFMKLPSPSKPKKLEQPVHVPLLIIPQPCSNPTVLSTARQNSSRQQLQPQRRRIIMTARTPHCAQSSSGDEKNHHHASDRFKMYRSLIPPTKPSYRSGVVTNSSRQFQTSRRQQQEPDMMKSIDFILTGRQEKPPSKHDGIQAQSRNIRGWYIFSQIFSHFSSKPYSS
jgi:hypothetical protein